MFLFYRAVVLHPPLVGGLMGNNGAVEKTFLIFDFLFSVRAVVKNNSVNQCSAREI
jgi:hypothetical protein